MTQQDHVLKPDPDWYLIISDENIELRTNEVDAVNTALDMNGIVEIHRLISIDKAEAYANARVRKALKDLKG